MADKISHSGIVESVESESVKVRILQTSACASCKVAGYCNASESKEKVVDVRGMGRSSVRVGDKVTVTASRSVAARALLLAFGIPFAILVAVLFATVIITSSETMGALVAMGALLPYYAVLYLLRDRLRNNITFHIEK